ncbi:hypothetical protein EDB81DRAFT_723433 [Dactylonectria macrodidyma]|uniref:FAD dependent oxidoreductase domain-containing protein n=1 Tax=Dactylonectria macrodidyma TaxID=307937 RepID=A0A9P9J1N9_9HYPO|nr:hypothetical protein EDB81DRAFT_723433 [Dactylonectria macrodidyma]
MARITIVGSGIIGLSIATLLARDHEVTIVARNLPGDDMSFEWASPWAGASFIAGGCDSAREKKMQLDAFAELWRWSIRYPESSIKRINLEDVFDDERDVWWKDYVPEFRYLSKNELPKGTKSGIAYTTLVMNPAILLPWMKRKLESQGVKFKRMSLVSLSDVRSLGHDVVINATGNGSKFLADIKDEAIEENRGQIMVVKHPYKKYFMRDDGENYTYVIPRLDGTVILGGVRQPNVHSPNVDLEVEKDILRRINASLPEIFSANPWDYEIIGYNVGLRTYRTSGIRVEKETKDGQKVVHAYGFNGGGYIYSFGAARAVVELVDEFLYPAPKANL